MTVKDIARTEVVTVSPDTTLDEVSTTLRDERVGSVVVTDGDRPIGLLTDRDIALALAEGDSASDVTARDVMSEDLVSVDATIGVYEALAVAQEAGVRRIPVVDGDTLYGIVTLDDYIVLLAGELDAVAGVIQSESPPY